MIYNTPYTNLDNGAVRVVLGVQVLLDPVQVLDDGAGAPQGILGQRV